MLTIKTDDRRQRILTEIHTLMDGKRRLYIWGKGEYARILAAYLRENGVTETPTYLVDDAYYVQGTPDAVAFSDFLRMGEPDSVILFGFYNYKVILEKKCLWGDRFPHLFDLHFTVVQDQRLEWDAQLAKAREAEYRATYDLLRDARSRRTMQLWLNAATAGEFDELFRECYWETPYFNECTALTRPDTLLDCGAYDGDSIHDFVNMFPAYRGVIAFEPDAANTEKIRSRAKRESIERLTIVNKGVYSESGTLYFQANGESNSHLSESGGARVEVTTLDEYEAQSKGRVFLKMDIEGSEAAALRGGERMIRTRRPIIAVCVYHREEDLITIPQLIRSIAGEGVYDYFLGFHGLDLAELCFYAIPREDR